MRKSRRIRITHKPSGEVIAEGPLGWGIMSFDALDAIKHGDVAAIGACFTAGIPRFIGRSRNTPPMTRAVRIVRNRVMNTFGPAGHV